MSLNVLRDSLPNTIPQTVKPLKGSRGTQWQLVAFAKLLSVDLILRLLCLFSIKLINNTKGHLSLSLQEDGPQYVLLWPTVPGNFHTFNTHKYTTPSIYFEQKEKKSQIKVKELLSSWNQTPLGMQITYCNLLLVEPLVSSVDEILSPRQQLSRGTQTNEKIFIVLAFQMVRTEEEALTDHCPWN